MSWVGITAVIFILLQFILLSKLEIFWVKIPLAHFLPKKERVS
jgi:hypothetical protein